LRQQNTVGSENVLGCVGVAGNINMAERAHQYGLSDINSFEDNVADGGIRPCKLRRPSQRDIARDDFASLFLILADDHGKPELGEYIGLPARRRSASISSRILAGTYAAFAAAVLFALFSSDAMRDVVSVKASLAGIARAPAATAQSDPSLLGASAENDRRGAGGSLARRLVGWRTNRTESQPSELSLTGKA
jgi:hypothetical protein